MGSFIEINDTLRITFEQGFPTVLNLAEHLKTPYKLDVVAGKIFNFKDKTAIRVFQHPPERNFLVQEIDGKWIYWGLCLVHSVNQDYDSKRTSGTFEIIRLNTPEEMKQVFNFVNVKHELNYFKDHV